MHTSRTISYEEYLHFFRHQYEGITNLIQVFDIKKDSSILRYSQAANSMFFAISLLYGDKTLTRKQRILILKNDFSKAQLKLLRYVSGKRNRIICTLLRTTNYTLFDYTYRIHYKR